MFSDVHISLVGYQIRYSWAVSFVQSPHHFYFFGHLPGPVLNRDCLALFDYNLLQYELALGQK